MGLESAFLEEIGLKHETVFCHRWRGSFQDPHGNKDGLMAAQTSASSSRASAKWAQRRGEKAGRVRYWQYGQAEKSSDLAISDPSRFLALRQPVNSRWTEH